MNSRLVIADAAKTKLCAWLSVSTFAGLLAFAVFGWTWINPVTGFVIAAFAIKEGREAGQGNSSATTMTTTDDGHHGGSCDQEVLPWVPILVILVAASRV